MEAGFDLWRACDTDTTHCRFYILHSLTSAIISCVVCTFDHQLLTYRVISVWASCAFQRVALSPCSEKPVALFPTPSTVS